MTYLLVAASCGNPDFGQDPTKAMCPPLRVCRNTLVECVDAFEAWRDQNDLGGGNINHTAIYDDAGVIGRISYNGRCWDKDDNEIKVKVDDDE